MVKVPLSSLFRALRYAAPGTRARLLRALLRSSSARPSAAENCEINSVAEFPAGYQRLAHLLGQSGKVPPPGELEFLAALAGRSTHYPGAIGLADSLFITAFVSILAPPRMVEIGTSTGFSAAVLAAAIKRQHPNGNAVLVDTIDAREQCIVEKTRPVGFEIAQIIPEFASSVRVHAPWRSDHVAAIAHTGELRLVFIDADHRHPSPLQDLLQLAPYIKPESWVLLHDTRLGTIGGELRARGETLAYGAPFGAEWLFDRWPFRKISGGNIGAVQLPNDPVRLIPFALEMMNVPFEVDAGRERKVRRALYRSFAALLSDQAK